MALPQPGHRDAVASGGDDLVDHRALGLLLDQGGHEGCGGQDVEVPGAQQGENLAQVGVVEGCVDLVDGQQAGSLVAGGRVHRPGGGEQREHGGQTPFAGGEGFQRVGAGGDFAEFRLACGFEGGVGDGDLPVVPGAVVEGVGDTVGPRFADLFVHALAQDVIHLLEGVVGRRLFDEVHHALGIGIVADAPFDLDSDVGNARADVVEGGADLTDEVPGGFPAQLDVALQAGEQACFEGLFDVGAQVVLKLGSGGVECLDGGVDVFAAYGGGVGDDCAPPGGVFDADEGDLPVEAGQGGAGGAGAGFQGGEVTVAQPGQGRKAVGAACGVG